MKFSARWLSPLGPAVAGGVSDMGEKLSVPFGGGSL